ncbi:helix-turn-helix domain-containing protein [Streptomyces turgidiscabies]|uniref:helix-turn-helix domain-containing protein n=1 Tax=Streptomyces turgidiscabies TaxID=85558 RepID=UPI0038F615C8
MRAAEKTDGTATRPSPEADTGVCAAPDQIPEWRRILQELPPCTPRVWLTGDAAERFTVLVARSYKAGGTLRGISEVTGRSYGVVRTAVQQAGVLRPRGKPRNKHARPHGPFVHKRRGQTLQQAVAGVICDRIADGTYLAGKRIPSSVALAEEFGVSLFTVLAALKKLRQERVLLSGGPDTLGTWVNTSRPPS